MRNDKYEKFIDGTIEASVISLWFAAFWCGAICITGTGFLIYQANYNPEASFLWISAVPSFVIALPITLFAFYLRKAQKLYDINRWRDFWIGFGHIVYLPETGDENKKMEEWLEKNMNHMYIQYKRRTQSYHFISKSDAMAFKLMWV